MKRNPKEKRVPRYSYEDKKQIRLLVLMAIVAVALLVGTTSLFFGDRPTDSVRKSTSPLETVVIEPEISTVPTVQTVPSEISTTAKEEESTNKVQDNKKPTKEQVTTTAVQQKPTDEKEEILRMVSEGINKLKSPDASFIGNKKQTIDIVLTDCSVPSVVGAINNVLKLIMGEEEYEYDFTNGVAMCPEEKREVTSNEMIPPTLVPFGLTVDGVQKAYKEKQGDNTVYTVIVVPEKGTLQKDPVYHSVACDILKIEEFNLPAEITVADYDYPGAEISVTYDSKGNVVEYHEHLDLSGVGEGHALGITASCTMEGYIDESWSIKWK